MTKSAIVLLLASVLLSGCSYRWFSTEEGDEPPRSSEAPSGRDTASDELVGMPAPGPLPSPGADTSASSALTADAGSDAPLPSAIPNCQGEDEAEPNDDAPAHLGPNACGTIVAGDVDKLVFDVREGNAFSVELTSAPGVRMQVDAPCIEQQDVEGPSVKVKLVPTRDCTIHVTLKTASTTKTGWHLRRDK
jgi:hypothetical protein